MSDMDAKENEETRENKLVDALDIGQLENVDGMDCNKQNSSSDVGQTEPVEGSSNPVENGEAVPDDTDFVVNGDDKSDLELQSTSHQPDRDLPPSSVPFNGDGEQLVKPDTETLNGGGHQLVRPDTEAQDLPQSDTHDCENGDNVSTSHLETAEPTDGVRSEVSQVPEGVSGGPVGDTATVSHNEPVTPHAGPSDIKDTGIGEELRSKVEDKDITTLQNNGNSNSKCSFLFDESHMSEGNDSGTEEDQSAFMKEVDNFFRERNMEFKPLKFYGEGLNYLKLWRSVTRLGGYDKVTLSKLWKQVGEAFRPPKTCTTVSWTFRGFYEKALLDYERHKFGIEPVPISSKPDPVKIDNQAMGSGRARRDAAARAMQGWHSQRLLGNDEVSDPIIKDKSSSPLQKRGKQIKSIGLLKRKQPPCIDQVVKAARTKTSKTQLDADVVDLGPPADWVKINVQKTKDCFEVYALVPGLLREEVRVQSDSAGRLVISGEPEHPDNPWGVTPFKKAINLPSKIDPHQTSAVVTLHGQLFVRVPFGQSEEQ